MIGHPPISPLFPYTPLFRSPFCRAGSRLRHTRIKPDMVVRKRLPHASDRKSTRLNSNHGYISYSLFFLNDRPPPDLSPLPLHAPLPISVLPRREPPSAYADQAGHGSP